ncbi:response regulator transcription factor [Trinickia dinghuensis]|uniref:response regulator transcription factor n=1 Tax=Trinickia dinghuensis TaxID=2291023 RepID=UPI0011C03716|nr:response regulator transcription factor [Trinickia dinghuensis]
MRFALITEDPQLTASLADCFAEEAIELDAFSAELPLFRAMRTTAFDVVLIDAKNNSMLVNSLLSWRNCNADLCTPVIVLTPFSHWSAMLRWINAGATDVASRFDLEQVRLRVHVALQRCTQEPADDVISLGAYTLRRDVGMLEINGEEIPLTPREFAMAWLFFSSPGKFLSRAQIASSVWGSCEDIAGRSIEQHVYKLRRKLRRSGNASANLKTVYALGYKLDLCAQEAAQDEEPPASEAAIDAPSSAPVDISIAPGRLPSAMKIAEF